jgi:hypothetical protein
VSTKTNNAMNQILFPLLVAATATYAPAQHPFQVTLPQNAPVLSEDNIIIHADPAKVWQVLSDINHWPMLWKSVSQSELKGPLAPKTDFVWKADGMRIHSTLHTVVSASYLGWTGRTMGIRAVHNWTLKEVENGTEVQVAETMQGFLASLFKKALAKSLQKGMRKSLEQLKTACEK